MQYLIQKIYFLPKIFGQFKKKSYLCSLNCDFTKKRSVFAHEENFTYSLDTLSHNGSYGPRESKGSTPL